MVQLALDIPKEQEAADILGAYFQRYKKKKIGVFSLTLKQDGQLVRRIITSETTESKTTQGNKIESKTIL